MSKEGPQNSENIDRKWPRAPKEPCEIQSLVQAGVKALEWNGHQKVLKTQPIKAEFQNCIFMMKNDTSLTVSANYVTPINGNEGSSKTASARFQRIWRDSSLLKAQVSRMAKAKSTIYDYETPSSFRFEWSRITAPSFALTWKWKNFRCWRCFLLQKSSRRVKPRKIPVSTQA